VHFDIWSLEGLLWTTCCRAALVGIISERRSKGPIQQLLLQTSGSSLPVVHSTSLRPFEIARVSRVPRVSRRCPSHRESLKDECNSLRSSQTRQPPFKVSLRATACLHMPPSQVIGEKETPIDFVNLCICTGRCLTPCVGCQQGQMRVMCWPVGMHLKVLKFWRSLSPASMPRALWVIIHHLQFPAVQELQWDVLLDTLRELLLYQPLATAEMHTQVTPRKPGTVGAAVVCKLVANRYQVRMCLLYSFEKQEFALIVGA
jgi:hypothetical protein